jgi:hypothetical protein
LKIDNERSAQTVSLTPSDTVKAATGTSVHLDDMTEDDAGNELVEFDIVEALVEAFEPLPGFDW